MLAPEPDSSFVTRSKVIQSLVPPPPSPSAEVGLTAPPQEVILRTHLNLHPRTAFVFILPVSCHLLLT